MSDWFDTEKGKELIEKAFETAGMPEVEEAELEPGTYTNLQLAQKAGSPEKFVTLLMKLPDGSPASKRSILSFAVEKDD